MHYINCVAAMLMNSAKSQTNVPEDDMLSNLITHVKSNHSVETMLKKQTKKENSAEGAATLKLR